jgi:hypothetical protein
VKLLLGISKITNKTASQPWGRLFEPVKLRADYWAAKQRWDESKPFRGDCMISLSDHGQKPLLQ